MKQRTDPRGAENMMRKMHGAVCWDIGAHIGQAADRLAQNFDVVHAFEPCEESFKQLEADHPDNVIPHRLAITEASLIRDGLLTLDIAEGHIEIGMLVTAEHEAETLGWGEPVGVTSVPATTMDQMVLVEDYPAPDAVKIDTEGHEEHVIRGGMWMLTKYRPDLFIEIHHGDYGSAILGLLRPLYKTFDVFRCPRYEPGTWGYDNHYYLSVT